MSIISSFKGGLIYKMEPLKEAAFKIIEYKLALT